MNSIKSFMNLKYDINNEVGVENIDTMSETSSGIFNSYPEEDNIITNQSYSDENILMDMLEEIKEKTREILENENKNDNVLRLSSFDIEKLTQIQKQELEKKFEETKKTKQKFKNIKYTILAINTVMLVFSVGMILYSRKSTNDQTKELLNNLENYTYKTKNIGNDSFLFKSHPKGSENLKCILTKK